MSNRIIEKLLNENKVVWEPLNKIIDIVISPTKVKKEQYHDKGKLPIIDQGEKFIAGYTDENYIPVEKGEYIIFGDHSEHIKYVDFSFIQGADGLKILKPKKDIAKYIYYAFINFYKKESSYKRHWSTAKETLIPIPEPEIQQKIVKTLDKFTELEATLEAELSLRVKQYHYYRDLLLNENEKNPFFKNAEYRCLGDITLLSSNIRWKNNTNSYKYIDLTSVDRENHSIGETIEISALTAPSRAQKLVVKDDVIFATTRPTQLRFAFINEEFENSIASTGYCVLRANTDLALPKWIYHNLGSIDFKNFLEENQSGSAYPAVSDSKVKEYKIPVPSLDIQEKIILILDKFENLANSIKDGLPREIKLRRKQYEYYRNELLSFS
ncbi:restriction endonuclease subunit S [Histophilus somni]|uniref:restriction endonuclease subunit S n=1 Tax=Histophilus somni TaxID=731 RepID=UPI00109C499E|nr:restriction endonuclease subunit S [Histophilus somni]THA22370.1 restriction endonuclease subunit S [Histophilus somni]